MKIVIPPRVVTLPEIVLSFVTVFLGAMMFIPNSAAQNSAEQKNMALIGHNDLNGHGDGGEGMAIQQRSDGRRILFIAHEGETTCLSIVDVTHPEAPVLLNQLPSPAPEVTRCNSLGLSGNVLAVADQTMKAGQSPAGMWVLDVSDLARIQKARSMQDLALSFFDTSGTKLARRPLAVVCRRAVRPPFDRDGRLQSFESKR